MFSYRPEVARTIAVGAYLAVSSLLVLLVSWSAQSVGTSLLRLLDREIIDGSGRIEAPDGPDVASSASGSEARLASIPAVVTPASTPSPAQFKPPLGVLKASTDNPEHDPAANFHDGRSSTYRTYCVRLCDGYFWPISFSTTADRFDEDAAACSAACGSPARLFVHRIPGGGPGTMVSPDGLPYSALKTAFMFRSRYDAQCRCQPQPWDQQARDRHRLYAAEQSARSGNRIAAVEASRLATELQAARSVADSAKEIADAAASRELAQLTKRSGTEPPSRTAGRSEERIRLARSEQMRLGAVPEEKSTGRFIPASGSGRAWKERVFSGN